MDTVPGRLLPQGARGAIIDASAPVPALLPPEDVCIARAVPKRRQEFARGRGAARAALDALGVPAAPIGVGGYRQPLWPQGIVGSITHCPALAWAAVAPADRITALGIDVEPAVALPHEVRNHVLDAEEAARLAEATGLDTVGFGAKECIHKAVYPETGIWLDFHDVRVVPAANPSFLRPEPVNPDLPDEARSLLARLEIRWAVQDGLIFTSAWAPAR